MAEQSPSPTRSVRHQRPESSFERWFEPFGSRWLVGRSLRWAEWIRHRNRPYSLEHEFQDTRDGEDLYRVLREEVIPLYFDRDRDGLPRGWIKRMKRTIRTLGWRFNADRMVMDYVSKCYVPAAGGMSSDLSKKL